MCFVDSFRHWKYMHSNRRVSGYSTTYSSTSLDTLNFAVLNTDPLNTDGYLDKLMMAKTQVRQADDSQPPTTRIDPATPPPIGNRIDPTLPQPHQEKMATTMTTNMQNSGLRARPRPRVVMSGLYQCTHLTMTRLYTTEYRCMVCLRLGSMGWIYRCSQDAELIAEEAIERGEVIHFDALGDIFERPRSPRPRSATARLSSKSFFDENGNEALKHYSREQVRQILDQRSHVLEMASHREDRPEFPYPQVTNPLRPNPCIISSHTPAGTRQEKPWFPLRGGECQFKCCHTCRPHSMERSWLSLDGIANDDLPYTAITGHGFHLERKRPVVLVKHVKNLGLRENPVRSPPSLPPRSPNRNKKFLIPAPTNPSLGLGIFDNIAKPLAEVTVNVSSAPYIPEYGPTVHSTFQSIDIPLGSRPLPACPSTASTAEIEAAEFNSEPGADIGDESFQSYEMFPLPAQSEAETESTSRPLTPMEELELKEGMFMSQPLEVSGGVAVMEESLDLRVADVVTQF